MASPSPPSPLPLQPPTKLQPPAHLVRDGLELLQALHELERAPVDALLLTADPVVPLLQGLELLLQLLRRAQPLLEAGEIYLQVLSREREREREGERAQCSSDVCTLAAQEAARSARQTPTPQPQRVAMTDGMPKAREGGGGGGGEFDMSQAAFGSRCARAGCRAEAHGEAPGDTGRPWHRPRGVR